MFRAVRFANFEGFLVFSVPSIILVDLLGNTWLLARVQRSWFVIRDWWISIPFVCFVLQGSLLCDGPLSGNNRLVLKFASQICLIFLIIVTCKNKATSASLPSTKNPLTDAISFAILEQSRVILSQAGRERYIMICINPAFTKMIDGTEKPKIPSKFAIRAARYDEFRCNINSSKAGGPQIDFVTVFDAILTSRQASEKLQ